MRSLWVGLAFFWAAVAGVQAQPAFTPGAGTEHRAWLRERPNVANPATRLPLAVTDGVIVTARDGVRLEGRLIAPILAAGAKPTACLLVTNGYGRTSGSGAGLEVPLFDLAARGYAVLHLSLRGSGKSEGTNDLYSHYGEDGYDTIEWMAKQPWCDGNVGMVGASLFGISQWLAAKEAPPHLKAIAPDVACGDCYGVLWYPGGMLPGPGREARKLSPGAEAEYEVSIKHRDFDDYWRARTVLAPDVAAIAGRGVAAFIAGGLDDYITPANIRMYEQFNSAAKRLFLGPYAHGWHTTWFQELEVQFLDHYVKGIANGAEKEKKVVLYIKGAGAWREEADWPLADAKPVTLHLRAARSGTIKSLNDGTLSAAAGAGKPVVLPYSPESGPFLPALLSATMRLPINQAPDEAKAVTWTSAPMRVATEVTGYPKLTLWAASSTDDGDIVAEINDLAPDGTSVQVIQGYMNVPRQKLREAPTPLVPGQLNKVELTFFPTAYVFQPGHRLRLAIAGGAKTAPDQPVPQGPGKNPKAFTWTIAADAAHAASLELPVVGTAWRQWAGGGGSGSPLTRLERLIERAKP